MASSITGNAGGASASGAGVYLVNTSGAFAPIIGAADSNGNFTFSGLVAGTYTLSAGGNFGSGAYYNSTAKKSFIYRSTVDITVDGSTAYTGIIIPAPTAP